MLTCRTLHRSRLAISSSDVTEPVTISLSHRRPCAIAVTSFARVSARIGLLSRRGVASLGAMTSRAAFDGFVHGMRKTTERR